MVAKDARKDAYLEAEGWTVTRIVFDGSDTPETIAQRITAVAA
jgi:very-short-patch-repair endonuclease